MNEANTLLELNDVHVYYGAIHALKSINLKVNQGEIVTILGANGSGKTTTLRAISGLLKSKKGSIQFKNQSLLGVPAYNIVAKGIAHAPEGRLVFPDLTVKENLEMGAYLRKDDAEILKDFEYVYHLFPRLKEREKQLAGTLSGGEQQMLAISRAFMTKPELLLLDEPSLGIAPILVQTIFEAIKEINQNGVTVLLVEQNAYAALKIAHRGYVMETGTITLEDSASNLLADEKVKNAYLGEC